MAEQPSSLAASWRSVPSCVVRTQLTDQVERRSTLGVGSEKPAGRARGPAGVPLGAPASEGDCSRLRAGQEPKLHVFVRATSPSSPRGKQPAMHDVELCR